MKIVLPDSGNNRNRFIFTQGNGYLLKDRDFGSFSLWLFRVFYSSMYILEFCSISVKNIFEILIEIELILWKALESMDTLTILILQLHENGISFYVFMSSISFINKLTGTRREVGSR